MEWPAIPIFILRVTARKRGTRDKKVAIPGVKSPEKPQTRRTGGPLDRKKFRTHQERPSKDQKVEDKNSKALKIKQNIDQHGYKNGQRSRQKNWLEKGEGCNKQEGRGGKLGTT